MSSTFVIPAPYKAWCHLCNTGFMSLEECAQHTSTKHGPYSMRGSGKAPAAPKEKEK
jgi:hypothetical protein